MRSACTVEGCNESVVGRGLCRKHYMRLRRKGSTDDERKNARAVCSQDDCGRPSAALGLCDAHYRVARRSSMPKEPSVPSEPRPCAHCGELVPSTRRRRGPISFCSSECKARARAGDGRTRESTLRSYYKRKYGLTMDQVEQMRAGGCAICGRPDGGGRHGQLHIDHCHATGRVRGALCDSCNTGLGKFRDDPELLRKAATYLS